MRPARENKLSYLDNYNGKAPRVTPEQVDAAIIGEQYHRFEGTTLTICCLTLANGFAVTGESACVSPENFDAELGMRIAKENAKRKVWDFEGYALRTWLGDERGRAA